jgi:hypothetical protein
MLAVETLRACFLQPYLTVRCEAAYVGSTQKTPVAEAKAPARVRLFRVG